MTTEVEFEQAPIEENPADIDVPDAQVLEPLSDEELALLHICTDPSGLDQAEFFWKDFDARVERHGDHEKIYDATSTKESLHHGRFRAWPYQWSWWRTRGPHQIDQSARSVGKSLSIKVRAFAFPFLFPKQEMVITAPSLIHLEPITSLIEEEFFNTRVGREMKKAGKGGVTHRPFQLNCRNGARVIGRIPRLDGSGVKGCVPAGTPVWTDEGLVPVEDLKAGDLVLTDQGRFRPLLDLQEDVNDCFEVHGQGSHPLTISCDHRVLGTANTATSKQRRKFEPISFHDVGRLLEDQIYWASPTSFPEMPVPALEFNGTANRFAQNREFWWLVGRWLADGYLTSNRRNGKEHKVHWTVHPDHAPDLTSRLNALGLHWSQTERDHSTADMITVSTAAWNRWLSTHFGERCDGKSLPTFVLGMNETHRDSLLEGYLAGDGHWNSERGRWELGTASKHLSIGLQLLAQSLGFTVNCSSTQPKTKEICGVALKHPPKISWRNQFTTSGNATIVDGHQVGKVRKVIPVGKQTVYNPIVDEDHSYVTGSIVSHNIHPLWLEQDEAQDYPHEGWTELRETLKRGFEGAQWRAHGVTRGLRDDFFKYTSDDTPEGRDWTKHRYPAMYRPNWSDEEREEKITQYGSYDDPDYRRNVLGEHGDASNPMFVLHRLMYCVDVDKTSEYNIDEYFVSKVRDEDLDAGGSLFDFLEFPGSHLTYRGTDRRKPKAQYWVGMDVGYTNDPSELLVWVEYQKKGRADKLSTLKLLSRIQLSRIGIDDQVEVMLETFNYYRPKGFAMDAGGNGLPLFQRVQGAAKEEGGDYKRLLGAIKGYKFGSKLLVDFDDSMDVDEFTGDPVNEAGIHREAKAYASDVLRHLVDQKRLELPHDEELLAQFQGSTWRPAKSGEMDQYGRRIYSKGTDHALDAARFFALGWKQSAIEEFVDRDTNEPVYASFL